MNLNNLDFNKLTIFSKIVEAGNYRLASEVLNVTPSALSQTITTLEHSLGVPLFHRIGKKLILTEAGREIQRAFDIHHSALQQALTKISGKENKISGMIHIGAYLEFAKSQLAPLLKSFLRRNPDVQVKFTFDTPTRLHRLLAENKLDVCFSIYPERESPLIQSQAFYRQELVLAAPQGLVQEKASYQEILETPMIEYYFNHQPIRRWIALHYKKKPKSLPIRTFAATAEMVLAMMQEGLGVGVVPEYLLRSAGTRPLIICRPTSKKLMDNIWMLQLKGSEKSPALDSFVKAVMSSGQN